MSRPRASPVRIPVAAINAISGVEGGRPDRRAQLAGRVEQGRDLGVGVDVGRGPGRAGPAAAGASGTWMLGSCRWAHRAKHRIADSRSACQRGEAPGGAMANPTACSTVAAGAPGVQVVDEPEQQPLGVLSLYPNERRTRR